MAAFFCEVNYGLRSPSKVATIALKSLALAAISLCDRHHLLVLL
ncbi:MAG: hypothetical protein SAJ12_09445 [Jaaginema sp. PMC 1079.18]|nr:hypothetical protein [Jaaginema sp. PMC 1079.18]MEC4867916.1 hypothetical protein [Jaaginema sp. PMC 1078.18]